MDVDPRLDEIDDCLYRVSTKTVIKDRDKVLLVQEVPEMWWGFPGGGVDHGETVKDSLFRELKEELGLPVEQIETDLKIIHYTLGTVVNGIPRMNLFYEVKIPRDLLKATDQVARWGWFSRQEFMELNMSASYADRETLAQVIFS